MVGKPARARWRDLLRGSLVDAIVAQAAARSTSSSSRGESDEDGRRQPLAHGAARRASGTTSGGAVVVAVHARLAGRMLGALRPPNLVMIYLLGVVLRRDALGPRARRSLAVGR